MNDRRRFSHARQGCADKRVGRLQEVIGVMGAASLSEMRACFSFRVELRTNQTRRSSAR